MALLVSFVVIYEQKESEVERFIHVLWQTIIMPDSWQKCFQYELVVLNNFLFCPECGQVWPTKNEQNPDLLVDKEIKKKGIYTLLILAEFIFIYALT